MSIIAGLLSNVDVYALYLPFLFVFAVFYALLVKTKVFGKGASVNRINAIVALIISLYVVVFSPFAAQISVFFASMFAMGSISIVTLLMFVMITGLLLGPFVTTEEKWAQLGKKMIPILLILAFLFTIGLFFSSAAMASWFGDIVAPSFGIPGLSGEDMALIALIVLTIIILYWLTSGEEGIKEVKLFGE